jgi:hypothetical protein
MTPRHNFLPTLCALAEASAVVSAISNNPIFSVIREQHRHLGNNNASVYYHGENRGYGPALG